MRSEHTTDCGTAQSACQSYFKHSKNSQTAAVASQSRANATPRSKYTVISPVRRRPAPNLPYHRPPPTTAVICSATATAQTCDGGSDSGRATGVTFGHRRHRRRFRLSQQRSDALRDSLLLPSHFQLTFKLLPTLPKQAWRVGGSQHGRVGSTSALIQHQPAFF